MIPQYQALWGGRTIIVADNFLPSAKDFTYDLSTTIARLQTLNTGPCTTELLQQVN